MQNTVNISTHITKTPTQLSKHPQLAMNRNGKKAHLVESGEEEGLFELRSSVVYVV